MDILNIEQDPQKFVGSKWINGDGEIVEILGYSRYSQTAYGVELQCKTSNGYMVKGIWSFHNEYVRTA